VLRDDREADWVEGHLRPLVGLASSNGAWQDRRSEAFFTWRRFLEALADERPLVLVFEDLHWADGDLLDFIEHVLEWVNEVPVARRLHGAAGAARDAARLGCQQSEKLDDRALGSSRR
jgi:hypothetical protein